MLEEKNPVLRSLTRIKVSVEYSVTCSYVDLFRGIATLGTVFCAFVLFVYSETFFTCIVFLAWNDCAISDYELWVMNYVARRTRVLASSVLVVTF